MRSEGEGEGCELWQSHKGLDSEQRLERTGPGTAESVYAKPS